MDGSIFIRRVVNDAPPAPAPRLRRGLGPLRAVRWLVVAMISGNVRTDERTAAD